MKSLPPTMSSKQLIPDADERNTAGNQLTEIMKDLKSLELGTPAIPIKSSRISNLPGELVLRIFHYLDAPASTCLGLTCTTFYAIHLSQHHRRTSLLDYVWYPSQGRFGQQWQLIQFYQLLEDWMEGVQGKKLVFNRHLELFIDKWVWGKGCEDISRVDYGRLKDLRPARYESLIPIIISIIKKWWG